MLERSNPASALRTLSATALLLMLSTGAAQAQTAAVTPVRPSTLYDIRAEVAPLDESDDLPALDGIPNLRQRALPAGAREIRIYSGLVIGYPHTGLVLREQGGRVSGWMIRYWPVNDSIMDPKTDSVDLEARYSANERGWCDAPRRSSSAMACVVRFATEPNWSALLALVDSVSGFDLPDASAVPHRGYVIDGWRLRVEARRDSAYRRYQYQNPQIYRPPEGSNALLLMTLSDSLFQFAVPPRRK